MFGQPQQRSWDQFTPVPIGPDASLNPRVAAYVTRQNLGFQVQNRTDLSSHRDLLVLELIFSPTLSFFVVNIYNDSDCLALDLLFSLPTWSSPAIVTGDLNLHNAAWSVEKNPPPESPRSHHLVDWAEMHGFHLLNRKGEVTFCRAASQSVLDLSFLNDMAMGFDLLSEWEIREDLDLGSDHIPITWLLWPHTSCMEILDPHSPFVFKEKIQEKWTETFTETLKDFPPLDYSSPDSTMCSVGNISLSLLAASEATLRRKSFHPKASPWFNEKVANSIELMRAARQHHKITSTPLHSPDIPSFLEFKRARREVRRTVRKAKRDWALSFTSSVAPEDVWKLTSWSKGVRKQRIPTLNDPLGGQAITSCAKQDLFFCSFFPPPPSLDGTPIVDPDKDNPNTRPYIEVMAEEVKKSLTSCSDTSAPGPSGIGYRAFKWLWSSSPHLLTEALGACLRHGIHHPDWKKAITIILTKPNKPSYADPCAYRPIQLLECFGKLLEKIVATRLTFDIGRLDLVPCEQFGGRTASSCLDAGMSLVHDVQTGWKKGLISSMLAIDIKGFFDHVNHDRLIYIIWRMGFPLPLVKWVKSFLTGRSASLRMDGEYSENRPIDIGIPQGSPCSPVLSVIYSSEVL